MLGWDENDPTIATSMDLGWVTPYDVFAWFRPFLPLWGMPMTAHKNALKTP